MDDERVERTAEAVYDSLQLFTRRLRQCRVTGELSPAESGTLVRLQQREPVTAAELARSEGISAQSMGATLGTLRELGLVGTTPDPEDGRRLLLAVTPAGRDLMARKRDARAQQIASALGEFTDAEVGVLATAAPLLDRLAKALR